MWVAFKTQKNGDSWGYESPDEEDIEVCIRSIDLWGSLFIDYYIVACQAFFSLFLIYPHFNKNAQREPVRVWRVEPYNHEKLLPKFIKIMYIPSQLSASWPPSALTLSIVGAHEFHQPRQYLTFSQALV